MNNMSNLILKAFEKAYTMNVSIRISIIHKADFKRLKVTNLVKVSPDQIRF